MKLYYLRSGWLWASLLLLAACNQATPQNPPPPPEVAVIEVHPRSVPQRRELVGRLAPTRVAQVRARIAAAAPSEGRTEHDY